MAISVDGKVVSASCVAVGGRLIAADAAGKIWRLGEPARKVMEHLNLRYDIGDKITKRSLDQIAAKLAEVLIEVITGPAESALAKELMITQDLDFRREIDEYTFSGGVAELIYGGNGNHNDIGPILAKKINHLAPRLGAPIIEPANKIRATVIGAGAHSLSISGCSGFKDNHLSFPMKNVPVIRVDVESEKLSIAHVVSRINTSFKRFDLVEGEEVVALYFRDPMPNSYSRVELFSKAVESALPNAIEKKIPIILIFKGDIACSVGNVMYRETGLKSNLLTLDELDLKEGDWIDIGEPLVDDQVFPVTVKSLVFHNN
jgi:ethanolamine utilization protein EutA